MITIDNIVVDIHENSNASWTGLAYFLTLKECKYIHKKIIRPNDISEFYIEGILADVWRNHRRSNV